MDFLDNIVFDNTVRDLLIVTGIILLVLLLRHLLSHTFASLLFVFIRRAWKNIEKKEFITMMVKPLAWLIVVIVSVFALGKLTFPSAWKVRIYGYPTDMLAERLGVCIIIIAFVKFVLSFVDFIALILEQKALLTKEKNDDQIIVFFRDLVKVVIGIAGILLVIKAGFNQEIGSLLTGLSIVGAALALAAKESLENIIASFIIFFDKPFFIGDTLKVNNVTGAVERIGLRSTRIRTAEKTLVTVPNKQMVDSIVDNYSMRSERRAEIKLELSLKTSSKSVESLIDKLRSNLAQQKDEIIKHSVFFSEFNKNGIIITIEYFTIPFSLTEFNALKQKLILEFKKTVDELELEMAASSAEIVIQPDGNPTPPPTKTII